MCMHVWVVSPIFVLLVLVAYFAGKFPAPHSAPYTPAPLTRPAFSGSLRYYWMGEGEGGRMGTGWGQDADRMRTEETKRGQRRERTQVGVLPGEEKASNTAGRDGEEKKEKNEHEEKKK